MGASKLLLASALMLICVLCRPMLSQSVKINSTVTVYSIAYFEFSDLQGVQSLWAAWSSETPDLGTNLAGWHATRGDNTDYPCWNQKANWRGISCLRYTSNTTSGDSMTWIIGLSLSDASISGILPSGIADFQYLVTLALTGNPNLTGHLPKELGNLPLNILDLHDNNFNGTIPMELSNLDYLTQLDLGGNQLTGPFPAHFGQTGTLQDYSISQNKFSGEIPQQAYENLTQLINLDISSNHFSGPLPNLSMLKSLNKLNLSNNGFTKIEMSTIFNGTTIPMSVVVLDLSNITFTSSQIDWTFLERNHSKLQELFLDQNYINGTLDITSMASLNLLSQMSESGLSLRGLQKLSLRNNNITDVISSTNLITNVSTVFYLQGNPYCNYQPNQEDDARRCYCKQICINIPSGNGRASSLQLRMIITTTTASAMFVIVMLLVSIYFLRRSQQNLRYLMKKFQEAEINPKRFEYNDLCVATRNFHEDMKLGAGGYGVVYKGILSSNNVVAVKRLFLKTQQAVDSFINEVVLITKLQHRNLVHLKGFCVNGKELLLIYEYVDNHDLDKVLLCSREMKWQVMNWAARMKICIGIAHGLYYLHASSLTKIVHRDIKASNILLDKDMNPKIADFGLARPFEEEKSRITTEHRAGTIGYLAPEYMLWGQLSDKADVFSFGVLLLEIVSGKRNRDPSMPEDQVYLPNRAQILHKEGNLLALIDPRLRLNADEKVECQRVLEVALMCVQSSVERRPTMLNVVSLLVGEAEIVITPDDSTTWVKYESEIKSIAEKEEVEEDEESGHGFEPDSSTSRRVGSSSTSSYNRRGPGFSHTTSRGALDIDMSNDMLVMGGR